MLNGNSILGQLRKTVALGFPLIATQLLGYIPQFVDTVMSGWHSPVTQASVGLANQIYALIFLFMLGTAIAISVTVSHYHGSEDSRRIRRTFQQGMWMTFVLGVMTFLAVIVGAYVPFWIHSAAEIAHEANRYLLTLAPGAAIFVFALSGRYFLEGMSYPRSNIIIQLSLIPVNIIGNAVFLRGWWIFPELGAQGMAIATDTVLILYAILLFSGIWRNPRWKHYRLFYRFPKIDMAQIKLMLRIGIPIAVAIVMEAGLFNVIGLIISRTNALQTAANQVSINFSGLMFMIPLGLSSAMTIRVAHERGRGDWAAVRAVALGGIGLTVILMCVSALLIVILRHFIADMYSDNHDIVAIVSRLLVIVAVFQIADGVQVVATGVLRGLQETRIAMYFAILGYWGLGFPAGMVLAYVAGYGLYGLWGGLVVGLTINALLGSWTVLAKTAQHRKPI